jgi:hypothetical protein
MTAQQKIDAILKDFVNISAAAKALKVTPRAVQRLIGRGSLAGAVRTGRDLWIPRQALDSRLNGHVRKPNIKPAKDLRRVEKRANKSQK